MKRRMIPRGIYIYNGVQKTLPLRYLYVNNNLIDFKKGINSTAYIYPRVLQDSSGQRIDLEGAGMYLSEKVKDSLVVKLYLMNDSEKQYPELKLSYYEKDFPFQNYYYNGFQGTIKIWEVKTDEMENILIRPEFKERQEGVDDLDGLEFKE
jgi:hypothetical protein